MTTYQWLTFRRGATKKRNGATPAGYFGHGSKGGLVLAMNDTGDFLASQRPADGDQRG